MKILVIEDEKKVAGFIKRGLEEAGYVAALAKDGEEGLYMAESEEYDLIILDLILPRKNGIEVCKELRQMKVRAPILILSAKDSVDDKVVGLDSGADDYLTKPFAFTELLARVRALLRRGGNLAPVKLQVGDLVLDTITREVSRAGKEIKLTNREYALLEYLMANSGKVLSRTQLSEHVWDYTFDTFSNVIDVYINYLRNKIDRAFDHKLINTVRGAGYIMKPPGEPEKPPEKPRENSQGPAQS